MLLNAFVKKLCPGQETLQKTGRMMKILTLFLLAGCLQLSAKTEAQSISLSLSNAPLATAFSEIQQQTTYHFVYTNEQLSGTSKITVSVQNVSLEKALELCFKDQPLMYSIEDKLIIVKAREKKNSSPAFENEIRGKVSNEKGEPITGASISVKGTKKGTASDTNGDFELTDVPAGSVIIISSIGYESREIIIGNNRNLVIHLQSAASALDEMIIKGYYSTSKILNTGSVSKITSGEIGHAPVSNPVAAMEGRAPGLYITQQTGVAGGNFTIRIRGLNSISSGNEPLYIIDGVPFTSTSINSASLSSGITRQGNPLNTINPSDIESIEILKDADATAIYGSRGANGVVLLTTKKGKSGKTSFDMNLYSGTGRIAHMMELLNTNQYLQMRHEAFKNDGGAPSASDVDINGTWDTTRSTNWQKALLGGAAHITDLQTSISGGNNNTQFIFGGSYHRETTVFPGQSNDQRSSSHFSLSHSSSNQKFKLQLSSYYSKNDNNLPQFDLTYIALTTPPDAPALHDANGNLNWQNSTWVNPLSYLLQTYKSSTETFLSNSVISYKMLPSLVISASLGYTKMDADESTLTPITSWKPALNVMTGSSLFANNAIETWLVEPQVNWVKEIGKGQLNVLVGTTFQDNTGKRESLSASGYTNDALLGNIQAASLVRVTDNLHTDYRYNSIFGRVGYNWLNKYLINLTARRDGSSRFGPGRQFANFGAVGIGWIFSREKFVQGHLPLLSHGKLRGSYGITGSDQIPDYGYLDTYSATSYPYQNGSGLAPTSLFNPDYGWETNKKLEIALELGFIKNRVLLTTDFYRNISSNQLVGYPLAPTTGFTSLPNYNLPATVLNTGVEMELNTINLSAKNLKWTTSVNLTIPRNKLTGYPGLAASTNVNKYIIGQPLTINKTFHGTGVSAQTGLYGFRDVDGDGLLTIKDLTSFVNPSQSYYGGIQNSINYKGIELSVLVQFVKQKGYDYFYNMLFTNPGSMGNQSTDVLHRWQNPGDISNIQRFSQTTSSPAYLTYIYNTVLNDNMVADASFIRVKNISLAWLLPDNWIKKLSVSSFKIYIQAQNLFTITKFKGIDPENNGAGRLAPLRVITGGLKITL